MSTIGGPGGIGGPKGPKGPDASDGPAGPEGPDAADGPDLAAPASDAAATTMIDKLAADIAAGHMSPREAIDRLVDATAGPELDAAERAELRELLTDLVANDPYLSGLGGRV
jgi:hypothetical protein